MHTTIASDIKWLTAQYQIPWEQLKNKTVLISGAAGFLPGYMVETILFLNESRALNTTVIAVVRNREGAAKRFASYTGRKDLIIVGQDINAPLKLERKIDFIIHAASQASPKYYSIDPVGTLSANTIGTANLLELARQHQVEAFLYFSSAEVYGQASRVPTAEKDYGPVDPLDIRSCYAESKRMGENMCISWHHQHGVNARIVRPFHTYGPGMKLDDGRIYADIVADVVAGRDIVLKSDGLARRAFCYIADAAAAFWLVLLKGSNGQAYNVGNPDAETSVRDLALLVAGLYPEKKIKVKFQERQDSYVPSTISVTCPEIGLIKQLGWTPKTSLAEGFRQTIESYS